MIKDCVSDKVLKDGLLQSIETINIPKEAIIIYDVIRVIDGVPLFLEAHTDRFFRSFVLSNREKPFSESYFTESIKFFISQSSLQNANIRCVYCMAENNQFLIYEIKHSYPTAEMYENGVECDIFEGIRQNPNVKQEAKVKTNAYKKIEETGVYEVLLVDSDKCITEGSKSNMFFVKNGGIVTAMSQDVLCGITRLQVFDLINSLHIPLEERKISLTELSTFDAVFLSGTSPKILPIRRIKNNSYEVKNEVIERLSNAYNKQIKEYIELHK